MEPRRTAQQVTTAIPSNTGRRHIITHRRPPEHRRNPQPTSTTTAPTPSLEAATGRPPPLSRSVAKFPSHADPGDRRPRQTSDETATPPPARRAPADPPPNPAPSPEDHAATTLRADPPSSDCRTLQPDDQRQPRLIGACLCRRHQQTPLPKSSRSPSLRPASANHLLLTGRHRLPRTSNTTPSSGKAWRPIPFPLAGAVASDVTTTRKRRPDPAAVLLIARTKPPSPTLPGQALPPSGPRSTANASPLDSVTEQVLAREAILIHPGVASPRKEENMGEL